MQKTLGAQGDGVSLKSPPQACMHQRSHRASCTAAPVHAHSTSHQGGEKASGLPRQQPQSFCIARGKADRLDQAAAGCGFPSKLRLRLQCADQGSPRNVPVQHRVM